MTPSSLQNIFWCPWKGRSSGRQGRQVNPESYYTGCDLCLSTFQTTKKLGIRGFQSLLYLKNNVASPPHLWSAHISVMQQLRALTLESHTYFFLFFFPKAQSLSRKLFYIRVHILDWGTAAHLKVATVKSALYCDAFWLTCYHKHILKMHYRIKKKKSFITIAVGRLSVQQPTKTTRIISLTAS